MKKILLIEPDKLLAHTYSSAMAQQGYRVTTSHSALSAIKEADKLAPDLIVLELQLIEHSGVEFLYELRSYSEWQDIPLIVLTNIPASNVATSIELLTNQLGLRAYLYKPRTTLAKLIKTIDSNLGVKHEPATN